MQSGQKEHRKTPRRPTRRAAEIVIAGIEQRNPCVIFDISSGGARLAIGRSTRDLPDRFTLSLYKDGSAQRDCEVVWFDYKYVGVKFVSGWYTADRLQPEQEPSQAPPRVQHNPDSPGDAEMKLGR